MQDKIFKVKIFEVTHKSVKSVKVFSLEIFRAVLEEHITRKRQLLIAEQSLEKNIRLVVNLYEALERFNTLYNDVPKHQCRAKG